MASNSKVSDHGLKLLTLSSPKTVKGEKQNWVTGILYLAPSRSSGFNVCPMASAGCIATCLNTAGRGVFNKVQEARKRKTLWFFSDRPAFMAQIVSDIRKLQERTVKAGMKLCIRLNGTSDILWHTVPVGDKPNIMAVFPEIQFYDYTKQELKKFSSKPSNYHITFSRSETNDARMQSLAKAGEHVAVVWRDTLPATWAGVRVVNADESDLRFLDPPNSIAGLKAKGKAKKDASGFVLDTPAADLQ